MQKLHLYLLLTFLFACAQENKTKTPQIGNNALFVKPAIEAFASDPVSIIPGVSKNLRIMWKIVGLKPTENSQDEIYLSGLGKIDEPAGFYDFTELPSETTLFTLSITNGRDTAEQQITVTVEATGDQSLSNYGIVFTSNQELDASFIGPHNANKSMHLYKINVDGSNLKKLTKDDKILLASDPIWSNARKRIIFSGNLLDPDPSKDLQSIYEMDSKGENVKALTKVTARSNTRDRIPSVSSDGKRLMYTSTSLDKGPDGEFTHGLKILNLDDTSQEPQNLLWDPGFIYAHAHFHPSEDKIVLNSSKDNPSGSYTAEDREIYIYNLTSNEFIRLTDDRKSDLFPVFSPDGHKILWCSNAQGNEDIYLLDFTVSPALVTNLTQDNIGSDANPAWSPNGKFIAFDSIRPATSSISEIWIMDADGKNPRKITHDLNAKNPTWIEP